ncbi:MAG: phosphonoacetate hydrolase, partial [Betaproteobacteria bacterium]|nr:phosphonoacetate hydrolase [Betaproteobacteria bacterium]
MLTVNNRRYKLPTQPTVVVCVDGCEPDYLGQAVATGQMPWMQRALAQG